MLSYISSCKECIERWNSQSLENDAQQKGLFILYVITNAKTTDAEVFIAAKYWYISRYMESLWSIWTATECLGFINDQKKTTFQKSILEFLITVIHFRIKRLINVVALVMIIKDVISNANEKKIIKTVFLWIKVRSCWGKILSRKILLFELHVNLIPVFLPLFVIKYRFWKKSKRAKMKLNALLFRTHVSNFCFGSLPFGLTR